MLYFLPSGSALPAREWETPSPDGSWPAIPFFQISLTIFYSLFFSEQKQWTVSTFGLVNANFFKRIVRSVQMAACAQDRPAKRRRPSSLSLECKISKEFWKRQTVVFSSFLGYFAFFFILIPTLKQIVLFYRNLMNFNKNCLAAFILTLFHF